jgi:Cof subfamily protein (haloacid dehalogenase superfamily)
MRSIYITDLDHTLLRSDQTISDFSVDVWNKKAKSSILSIATARSYTKSHEFLQKMRLDAPMILLDGSMVVSPSKELIDLKLINRELGDAIIYEGSKFDIYPFIIALKDMDLNEAFLFPTKLNQHQNGVLENYRDDPRMIECSDIRAMDMNLKLVYFGDYRSLHPLYLHLKESFGDELEYKLSPENYSNGYFLTILHPSGDKAHALKTLAEYIGSDLQEFTVFGDSINDIGMFEIAGRSVAVANALDEVKAKADTILPHTNDEDGVAKYLNNNLS